MSAWSEINLEPEMTADGSPSLRFLQPGADGKRESMHHSGGAYVETQLIYGSLIRDCLDFKARSFCVVGLGLGYIELFIVLEARRNQAPDSELFLVSFESVQNLKAWFILWLRAPQDLSPEIQHTYELMSKSFLMEYSEEEMALAKTDLLKMLLENRWRLEGNFDFNYVSEKPLQCICFDAYSTKTSPDVWQEDGMVLFLKNNSASECQLGTYASNGILKRALSQSGFVFEERRGFTGKRNSGRGIKRS